MNVLRWRTTVRSSLLTLAFAPVLLSSASCALAQGGAPSVAAEARGPSLPERMTSAELWKLIGDISEPGGYFQIEDNFTSNEREVGQLFTMLRGAGTNGGVYLGVGPEQNFTYIAAVRPSMAFIIDIRRQAVMQHLMFKAMFELAHDRAEFISLLFSKPRPAGLDSSSTIERIWDAYWQVETDTALASRNLVRVEDRLLKHHGFALTDQEKAQLRGVFNAFVYHGPVITTRGSPSGRGGMSGITFADLTGYSYDDSGKAQSFLSSEENYRFVKSLHDRNLVVPVSGDFGGPKAIREIGSWLSARNGRVSAFYVSNVEQYLFQDGKQRAFYDNVATLPVGESSVFIRPYSIRRGGGATQSLCPIAPFLSAVSAGRVHGNNDALACVSQGLTPRGDAISSR